MLGYPINVTLDTNIIEETKYDFGEDGALNILEKYVKQNKVKVYLSTIVVGEITQHCNKAASEAYRIIRNSVSEISKIKSQNYSKRFSEIPQIPNKNKMISEGLTFVDDFKRRLCVELIDIDKISLKDIFEDYFNSISPFEKEGKKKSEFPDAVISKQIKYYFKDQQVYVLTKDKGFIKSLDDFHNAVVLSSIGELNKVIVQKEKDYQSNLNIIKTYNSQIIELIMSHILDGENIELVGAEYDRKGICHGIEYEETSFNSVPEMKIEEIDLTYFDDSIICADISCKAEIEATGSYIDYGNSPWDSENKEYVFKDWHTVIEEHEVEFTCQISLQKKTNQLEIVEMNILLSPRTKASETIIPSDSDIENEEYENACLMDI